ncbi:MAG: type III-A CRISPR-associated RAMP protein Csm4 [Desulfitobacteriia bacterium]|jgi:CRISPR-associated protein Csm4
MKYSLYKLEFTTAIHIGDDSGMSSLDSSEMAVHADTLFSALCLEALQSGGQELLSQFSAEVRGGKLLLSDALPYDEEEYYLPKPVLAANQRKESSGSHNKKKFKDLKYIPVSQFSAYLKNLQSGSESFDPESINKSFGNYETYTRAAIKGLEETKPYHIGVFRFIKGCGLYIIAAYSEDKQNQLLYRLLTSLSYSGLGGKRTSGLGKFKIAEVNSISEESSQPALKTFYHLLTAGDAPYQMAISVSLPKDEELEQAAAMASYSLVRRGGFVQSSDYADTPLKKRVIYMFSPGSCFAHRFEGDIYDVAHYGRHPVYRYGKPMFMGVKL